MSRPGIQHRFGLRSRGAGSVSKYRTVRPRATRNAVIHTTLSVASSGPTRANRLQGSSPWYRAWSQKPQLDFPLDTLTMLK